MKSKYTVGRDLSLEELVIDESETSKSLNGEQHFLFTCDVTNIWNKPFKFVLEIAENFYDLKEYKTVIDAVIYPDCTKR